MGVHFRQIQQNIEFRVSGPEGQCSRKFEKILYFNDKTTIGAMLLEDGIHIVHIKNCTIFEVSATKNLMRMPILKRNFLGLAKKSIDRSTIWYKNECLISASLHLKKIFFKNHKEKKR